MTHEGYDGLTEYQEQIQLMDEAEEHLNAMRDASFQATANEAEFRKAIAIETLNLQAMGVPATLIRDRVRGIPYIAELKQQMDNSNAIRDVEHELSQLKKKRAGFIHEERMREYGTLQGGI